MARQLTDEQRARKNLKARIKYAEQKKGLTFQYSDVSYEKFEWETEEEYIKRISEYRGEDLWEQGEEESKYIDEMIIPNIEQFFADFENDSSSFPTAFQYRLAQYKKDIAQAAFNTALSNEGEDNLAERLTELTNANEIYSLLERAIYTYVEASNYNEAYDAAYDTPELQEFISLMEGKGLSVNEAQELANYYGY